MVAIGVGLLWVAYWTGLTGYSLIRGYCNTPGGLANPVNPAPWSTIIYTGNGVFPSGCGQPAPASAATALQQAHSAATAPGGLVQQEIQSGPTGTTNPK